MSLEEELERYRARMRGFEDYKPKDISESLKIAESTDLERMGLKRRYLNAGRCPPIDLME